MNLHLYAIITFTRNDYQTQLLELSTKSVFDRPHYVLVT